MPTAVETMKEAICREVRFMARGYAAHECGVINKISDKLDKVDCKPYNKYVESYGLSMVRCRMVKEAVTALMEVDPSFNGAMIVSIVERITSVSSTDPMAPYADNAKWWPHTKAEAA